MNDKNYPHWPEINDPHAITRFREHDFVFSNLYPCHIILAEEEIITGDAILKMPAMKFNSVENAYVAWKTADYETRLYVGKMTPKAAAKYSHAASGHNRFTLRHDFEDNKRLAIMRQLVEQKYSEQNPYPHSRLLHTGNAVLIEGNDWNDRFFGVDRETGRGFNHLGIILMETRQKLQA